MNLPGTTDGNWEWRMAPGAASDALADRLRGLTKTYGRVVEKPAARTTETGRTGRIEAR